MESVNDKYKNINMKEILANYIKRNGMINIYGGKSKSGFKWSSLKHNGVLLAPEYIQHNIPVIYNGQEIKLNEVAEEYATAFAKYIGTDYMDNKIFKKNFWNDWKKLLEPNTIIKNIDDCDFSKIRAFILKQKEDNAKVSKEEKDKLKAIKDKNEAKYKVAFVDNEEQPVGNYRMEPPGIFLGRGSHPKLGSIKQRIMPENITINIGKGENLPEVQQGHKWHKIIHDRSLEWLASWIDNVTGKRKYVWLGSHSKFKADSDIKKFDLARKLKKKIKGIREQMNKDLISDSIKERQLATVLYIIDNFALRAGNEKNSEDSADTIGTTSLRKEHIEFKDNNTITLDFLGKDSIRYHNSHQVSDMIYKNLVAFTKDKKPNDNVFDEISTTDVNEYLQQFMKDLTAKVFRTYNASNLFQKELNKVSNKYEQDTKMNISQDSASSSDNEGKNNSVDKRKLDDLVEGFNRANMMVAKLCNHSKTVSKSHGDQLGKIDDKIKEHKKSITKLKNQKKDSDKTKNINDKIAKLKVKIKDLKQRKAMRDECSGIALGTSKANYIDPRIVVAFAKKNDVPIEKLYSKSEMTKFGWAINSGDVDENWQF